MKKEHEQQSESSKRKITFLQEKIETFERYFEQGNGDIDGQTIFEGKPIGKWAITIRSILDEGVNPTKEQLERLEELGILERRIDSTIDEKIDALIEWKKKYPDIIIERKSLGQPISEKIIEKLKEIAQTEGVEFSEIEERYRKIRSYDDYVKNRRTIGKLTKEQLNRCKEGNLRGDFGFPKEIEELANKLKIDIEKVSEIITSYGSIDDFLQMYRDGKLSDKEVIWYNNNLINNMIDIDNNPLCENYSNLLRAVFGMQKLNKNRLMLFSSKKLEEGFEILTPREMSVMQHRFGLIDGEYKTLKEVGKELNIPSSKVRQIEVKYLRKLKHPSNANQFKPITIEDLKENEYVSDEERDALTNLENYMWNSNLIFKHDSIDDVDFDEERFDVVRKIQENISFRKEEAKKEEKADSPENNSDINIEKMNISLRSFTCLKRAGINTLTDLSALTEEELFKIRNLGRKSMEEIISKLDEYGIKLATYSQSELEDIRKKKAELEVRLEFLKEQTKQAKKLLAEYNKIIGDDKVNADDETPDFKDE